MEINQATVIGGNGFVGRALLSRLNELGWQVWIPAKNDPRIYERELGVVYYCAGLTADYLQRPFDTVDAHVSFLNLVVNRGSYKNLVYLSSTRVYDGLTGCVDENVDLHLNPNNPRHIYDLSKLLGESICLKSGKASVARLACVYNDDTDEDGFLPQVLRRVLTENVQDLSFETSPFYERDYVCLNDVVSALIYIGESEHRKIYNVASGENIRNQDLFSLFEQVLGAKIYSTQNLQPAPSPVINVERMMDDFSWRATPVLDELRRIIEVRIKK